MKYRIFFTELKVPPGESRSEPAEMKALDCETRELAIEAAFKLLDSRAVVWAIDGPDEFLMVQGEVAREYCLKTGKWPHD